MELPDRLTEYVCDLSCSLGERRTTYPLVNSLHLSFHGQFCQISDFSDFDTSIIVNIHKQKLNFLLLFGSFLWGDKRERRQGRGRHDQTSRDGNSNYR